MRFVVCTLLAVSLLAVSLGPAQTQTPPSGKVALYAGVGPDLTHYEVDIKTATLLKRRAVTLPGNIQYAWPHPALPFLYVAWGDAEQPQHGVSALRIEERSGALSPSGPPALLPWRAVHLTLDIPGSHLLVAYNNPSALTVHRVGAAGAIGSQVQQAARLDTGIYAHQVRVDPSNRSAILVTRGNGPAAGKPEDPGALKLFGYSDGLLTNRASIAPEGGFNFQPRHLDFDPAKRWIYVSLERQNKLQVYKSLPDGMLSAAPLFTKDSLADPGHVRPGQAASTVHVHPNGRFVYQGNRCGPGGENSIAVYSINQQTGEPALIQTIDTRGTQPRTFALDPSGRILVAANQVTPASLAVYRIRADGKLEFVRKYAVEADAARTLFWMGLVKLP